MNREIWDDIVNNYINGNKKDAYKLARKLTANEMIQFIKEDKEMYGYDSIVNGRLSLIDLIYIAKG